mmetsp:Transcript_3708/g.9430  ORF Transcript_3708/g.9430 Transcript_3708/m.9430 type:complete len:113 (+) Transcript_3708:617-955(+)
MGIGCGRGAIIIPGAMTLVIVPIKKDDFMMAAGTTGKVANDSDPTVSPRPDTISIRDAIIETPGPHTATSNKSDRVRGKDLRGVIDPKVPTCNEGRMTGHPNLTPLALAATA